MWMTRVGAVALAIALAACSTVADRKLAAIDADAAGTTSMPSAPEPIPELVASAEPPAAVASAATAVAPSMPDAEPKPSPVIAAKPAPQPVVAEKSKPQPLPKANPKSSPKPFREAKPEPVVQAKRKPKPEPEPEPEPEPVVANSISGRVELDAAPGQRVAAGEVSQAVVYFLPRSGGARPKPGRFSVDTHSKGFRPTLSVVPVGSTVSFPNKDVILHNVFSNTPGSTFDLGTYGPGETRSNKFIKAGLVSVNCNVHNGMRANVLVLSTPYYTRPRADGRFVLDDLPPGPGTLVFWHPRARAQSQAISGPMKQPVTRQLVASRPSLDSHVH